MADNRQGVQRTGNIGGIRCTWHIQIAASPKAELRQVQCKPPWFDVYFNGEHHFGTLDLAAALMRFNLLSM